MGDLVWEGSLEEKTHELDCRVSRIYSWAVAQRPFQVTKQTEEDHKHVSGGPW